MVVSIIETSRSGNQLDGAVLWTQTEELVLDPNHDEGGEGWGPSNTFSWTFAAADFTNGTEGNPISFEIKGTGDRGYFFDNVLLTYAAGVVLSSDVVSSNAAPGTLVGTLSYADADEYVITGGADSDDFLITRTNELRTADWVTQSSYAIEVTAYSNSTGLVTNNFTINTTSNTWVAFKVSAEMKVDPSTEEVVGILDAEPSFGEGTAFSIVSGRDDLFKITNDTNLVQVAGSNTDAEGGIHHVEVKARNGAQDMDAYILIGANVISGTPDATVFKFR